MVQIDAFKAEPVFNLTCVFPLGILRGANSPGPARRGG